MIKNAIEETRLAWWRAMAFFYGRVYNALGFKWALVKCARYCSRVDGYINLKQMDEEDEQ